MKLLPLRVVKCLLAAIAIFAPASALAGSPPIVASWTLQSTSSVGVPTLGSYGALALAVLVALIIYRTAAKNPRLLHSVAIVVTTGAVATSVFWAKEVLSGAPTIITIEAGTSDACDDATAILQGQTKILDNQCGGAVTVTYTINYGSCDTVEDLTCDDPDISQCVFNSGSVQSGEARQLLGCYRAL